jgi:hypothetical protein
MMILTTTLVHMQYFLAKGAIQMMCIFICTYAVFNNDVVLFAFCMAVTYSYEAAYYVRHCLTTTGN